MSGHSFLVKVSATLSAVLIVCGMAYSQPSPAAASIERGRATFHQFCANCHGERGDAKGHAAGALKPPPVDLRLMTKRYGTFPTTHVRAVVTGQDESAAHTPAMKTWGPLLLAEAHGNEAAAASRVDDLLAYLESVQAK